MKLSAQTMYAAYLRKIDFPATIEHLNEKLSPCRVCPFQCEIDRYNGTSGKCRTGSLPKIASCNIHHGEEPPVSGFRGSGAIFFSGCSLRCMFCQNYPISQLANGNEVSIETLSEYMLSLQKREAHNVNLVTPTHFVPQIVEALWGAIKRGLRIPILYNSSGYDDVQTLQALEGIIDIYLPDMKYGDNRSAEKYSGARCYVEINRAAIREMYRQVGELVVDEDGIAQRGLIIRHLILPGNISNTLAVLEFITQISKAIPVSLMSQYFPAYNAPSLPELRNKIGKKEYEDALCILDNLGLVNGWTQPL